MGLSELGNHQEANVSPTLMDGAELLNAGLSNGLIKPRHASGLSDITDNFDIQTLKSDRKGTPWLDAQQDSVFASANDRLGGQAVHRGTRQRDRLVGTNKQDVMKGLGGNDVLLGRRKGDRLVGGKGHDRLNGNGGGDVLLGQQGRDRLKGGGGRDTLEGGTGKDTYRGGRGKDTFVVGLGDGSGQQRKADKIVDFKDGKDTIQLKGIEFESLDILQATGKRTKTILQHRETGEYLLVLNDIASDTITRDDFNAPAITEPDIIATPETSSSFANSGVNFSGTDTTNESEVQDLGGSSITFGSRTVYIGYRQVSSNNQNPIVASFDSQNPGENWVRTDYEITGADSRGYGLFWSGSNLYGAFSVDGTQGQVSEDFRRASDDAVQGWLRSYGSGGGPKVSVIARIDPLTGDLLDAAYLSALLSSGKSNSLVVEDIGINASGNLVVQAQSWFSPRNPDGSAMTQIESDSSPFDYTVEITPDLKQVVSTSADGWQ